MGSYTSFISVSSFCYFIRPLFMWFMCLNSVKCNLVLMKICYKNAQHKLNQLMFY